MAQQHELHVTQAQHHDVMRALERNEEAHRAVLEVLARQDERQKIMEERLRKHYESEHKAFDSLVTAVDRSKFAAKMIGILLAMVVGAVSASAHVYDWIVAHFFIRAK